MFCILSTAQFPREHLLKHRTRTFKRNAKLELNAQLVLSQTESNKGNDLIVTSKGNDLIVMSKWNDLIVTR